MTHQTITALDGELIRLARKCWPGRTVEVEIDDDTLNVFEVFQNGDVKQTLLLLEYRPGSDVKLAALAAMTVLCGGL